MNKVLVLSLLICSILTSCSLKEKTLAEFYTKDLDYVTKIEILDGSTGNKKTVTEKKFIDDFLKELNEISFIPEKDQNHRVGFLYAVTLVQG